MDSAAAVDAHLLPVQPRLVSEKMCVAERVDGQVREVVVSGKSYTADVLAPEDSWIADLDHEGFKQDVRELGKRLTEGQGEEDMAHLRKIIRWQRLCVWTGALTMWYCVNPISIYLLSLGTMVRWTIIGHREYLTLSTSCPCTLLPSRCIRPAH